MNPWNPLNAVTGDPTGDDAAQPLDVTAQVEKVPFYKRELGFRRNRPKASQQETSFFHETVDPVAATPAVPQPNEAVADEPVAGDVIEGHAAAEPVNRDDAGQPLEVTFPVEKVPFYKRELGFRRSRPDASAQETPFPDETVDPVAETPAVPQPIIVETPVESESEPFTVTADAPVAESVAAQGVPNEAVADEPFAGDVVEDPAAEPVSDEPVDPPAPVAGEPSSAKARFARRGGTHAAPTRKSGRGKGRKVVGLKIGASQLAAAVVADTDTGPELVQLARRPLESGIVVDGEVRDADALTSALKALFAEHDLPTKDVRIGLASNRIGVRMLDIVGIEDDTRFDNAVRFKAHEVLPVAVHESVLDYRVIEERPNEAGETSRRVLLVVAPRDQVEPYTDVARRAGLKLAGIDLEALGLLRAFVEPEPFAVRSADDTATVVVAIGHESSTLLVAGGGICEFTRVFEWGGGALQDAIAQQLDVRPAEAATILRHLSLSGPGRQFDALDEVGRAKALDAVRHRLTPFTRELVSSLQFYQTQPESLGIGEILITGGISQLEGLGEVLHQMIGVQVNVGDPLSRVRVSGSLDPAVEATIGSMAVPIGLAIDDVATRGVNLLPRDLRSARRNRPSRVALAVPVAVAVPVAALALLFVGARGAVGDRQAELDSVQAQISALPEPKGPEIDPTLVGEQAQRATAVASVLGGRIVWDGVFRDLARVLPANVWLTQLSAKAPDPLVAAADATATATGSATTAAPVVATTPSGVTMEGYTYTQPDVARLLARLATLPSLSRVTLSVSEEQELGDKTVVRFVVLADLNPTGGSR